APRRPASAARVAPTAIRSARAPAATEAVCAATKPLAGRAAPARTLAAYSRPKRRVPWRARSILALVAAARAVLAARAARAARGRYTGAPTVEAKASLAVPAASLVA